MIFVTVYFIPFEGSKKIVLPHCFVFCYEMTNASYPTTNLFLTRVGHVLQGHWQQKISTFYIEVCVGGGSTAHDVTVIIFATFKMCYEYFRIIFYVLLPMSFQVS